MGKTLSLTRYLALATAGASLIGLAVGLRSVTARESPATDCLIAIQDSHGNAVGSELDCTDCDPACDGDADNSTPNGQCTFKLVAVANVPNGTCTAKDLKKAKVTPAKLGITLTTNGTSSVTGAFAPVLKLKGHKSKQVVKKLKAMAIATGHPVAKDIDKIKLVCKRQTAATCPTTTTTTTLPPVCGDGHINGTEACDPAATPNGCAGTETCLPASVGANACTCLTCSAVTQTLKFTTGTDVTTSCGGPGFEPPAIAPTTGTVTVHNTSSNTDTTFNLGAGCLYIGGGGNGSSPGVPGGITPDGASSVLDVSLSCSDNSLVLAPHSNSSDPLDRLSCTKGPGPGKSCINNVDTFPLTSCTSDTDCGGVAGACVPAVNCFFGPPLPIRNGGTSTCVLNTFLADGGGSINKVTGVANMSFPLASNVFVTGNDTFPCPQCVSNHCVGGTKDTQACTPVGSQLTSLDCPPAGPYLPQFAVTLDPLSTGTVSKSAATPGSLGMFCPLQDVTDSPTTTPGAFGTSASDSNNVATNISQTGVPAGDITDMAPHASTLASVFCIPATGNGLIDGSAFLPGPGAVSLPGTAQLQ
jgi:hypothetical protein